MKHLKSFALLGCALFFSLTSSAQSPKVDTEAPWSVRMAESEMIRCPEAWQLDFQPRLKWDYCHGVELGAFLNLYDAYGDKRYYDYTLQYCDTMVHDDGSIETYRPSELSLDRINTGKIFFRIYEQTKDIKYKKALDMLRAQLTCQPRTKEGGFWHKLVYPNQMWLDGIYMGSPFYAEYAFRNNRPEDYQDVIRQFVVCARHTYDPATGLYRHAWDEARKQPWADKKTGQSPHTWGRAMGWYAMALVDALEFIPKHEPGREEVMDILDNVVTQIARWQDKESGLWYQVIDQPEREGNFPEASVTTQCMYAIAKAVNKGYIDPKYRAVAEKAFNGLKEKLLRENPDGTLTLTRCCQVGGLGGRPYRDGSYGYYIGEKIRDNDAKATGPYIMGCLELGQTD